MSTDINAKLEEARESARAFREAQNATLNLVAEVWHEREAKREEVRQLKATVMELLPGLKEQFSNAQIAEAFGCKESTIGNLVSQQREKDGTIKRRETKPKTSKAKGTKADVTDAKADVTEEPTTEG